MVIEIWERPYSRGHQTFFSGGHIIVPDCDGGSGLYKIELCDQDQTDHQQAS